jgi:hypothetical protein
VVSHPSHPRVVTGRKPQLLPPSGPLLPLLLPPHCQRARPGERSVQAAARPSHPPTWWGGRGSPPPGRSRDLPPGCRAADGDGQQDDGGGGSSPAGSGGGRIFRLDLAARGSGISSDGSSSAAVLVDLPPAGGGAPAPVDGSTELAHGSRGDKGMDNRAHYLSTSEAR